jgi:hypothetical protein
MSILLNISSADSTNVTSTTQYSYTFTQWQSFCSMKLVNVCIPNVQYNITSGNSTITVSGTTSTISPGLYSNSILLSSPGLYSNSILSSLLNATVSGITATYSSTTFRIALSGSASFTLSFSQGIAQVLGFLPNTTCTVDSSFVITAPNAVNLSPNDTYFLTISNLPNNNQSSGSFTFSFFINVNQNSRQILFLSSSEKDQSIQMGNTITTNHLNVELKLNLCKYSGITLVFYRIVNKLIICHFQMLLYYRKMSKNGMSTMDIHK